MSDNDLEAYNKLQDELTRLRADLAAAQADVARLRTAIETVLCDDESAPGGWGPDVTCKSILREALKGGAK